MRVAVLHGRVPPDASRDEQDALVEAQVVCEALTQIGHEAVPLPLDLNLEAAREALQRLSPALVFNIVESVEGRGQLIYLATALLDRMGLSYTGARTSAMFTTSNKLTAKRILAGAGIATPAWLTASELAGARIAESYIVKSVWEHASIGIGSDSLAADAGALRDIVAQRAGRFGGEWFAERYIEGREFNLSLLAAEGGPQVLPPAEIDFVGYGADRLRIVDYRAKWDVEAYEFHHTPRRFDLAADDRPLLDELRRIALQCWQLFDLRGYARVDFRVDGAGKPWVLEINTNPCLAPDAGFLAAAHQAGLSIDEVVRRIVADGLSS